MAIHSICKIHIQTQIRATTYDAISICEEIGISKQYNNLLSLSRKSKYNTNYENIGNLCLLARFREQLVNLSHPKCVLDKRHW